MALSTPIEEELLMAINIRYLGWTAFHLSTDAGTTMLLDPMLNGDPKDGIPAGAEKPEAFQNLKIILVKFSLMTGSLRFLI